MPPVAVITDTDSSLPASIAAQYGITQVPITIHFGDEILSAGVEIEDIALFERIDRSGRLPTTSAPPPGAFSLAYRQAFKDGAESIVCICVSSKISATYNAALTACEEFPDRQITVIDSLTVSMGQGFMALAAAEAAQSGAAHTEVVARAQSVGERIHLYASLSTLKYLAMSGRVGKIAAGMAGMLNIQPILTIKEGKLDMLERVRTRKAAMNRLVELTTLSLKGRAIERVAFIHVNNPRGAAELQAMLADRIHIPAHTLTVSFGPGLSVHTGSGMVGAAIIATDQ
ncbi:MAG: DegV family protein [Anaerolineaceae bacterium]|nr:DegV family protein [Anaerolineaceae bacterium]